MIVAAILAAIEARRNPASVCVKVDDVREIVSTPAAPQSPLYSQAVKAGQHVCVSGMVGIDVATGKPAGSTIQDRPGRRSRTARRSCGRQGRPWTTSSRSACC
jgi:hypothetical protein